MGSGNPVITGGNEFKERFSSSSPVWRAYQLFNNFEGRQSWDQIAVLVSMLDYNEYWDFNSNGYSKVYPDESNKWISESPTNHSYVIAKVADEKLSTMVEDLMAGEYAGEN